MEPYRGIIEHKLKKKKRQPQQRTLIEEHVSNSLSKSSTTSQSYKNGHYINCDLRYFNLASLGKFDIVYMDPPVCCHIS